MNQQYHYVTDNNQQLGLWNIKIWPINIAARVLKLDQRNCVAECYQISWFDYI